MEIALAFWEPKGIAPRRTKMKDHLNVLNPLAGANANRPGESMNFNVNTRDPSTISRADNPDHVEAELGTDDMYETRVKDIDRFDESYIEGMDFALALDYTKFIREQALQPEGRQVMELSHNPVTAQQVAQLFRTA
jgi:hypothetical protein